MNPLFQAGRLAVLRAGPPALLVVSGFPAGRYLPSLDASTANDGEPAPLLVLGLYPFERYLHGATVGIAAGVCVVASAALVQARVLSLADLVLVAAAQGRLWSAARVALARGQRVTRRRARQAPIGTQADGGRGG